MINYLFIKFAQHFAFHKFSQLLLGVEKKIPKGGDDGAARLSAKSNFSTFNFGICP